MSVLAIFERKCTLAASRAAPGESRCLCALLRDKQTERRTDGRTPERYITLSHHI